MKKIIISILKKELRPYFLGMISIVILILVSVGFETFAPWPFKILIDNVLGDQPLNQDSFLENILSFFTSREALGFFTVLLFCISSLGSTLFEYLVNIATKKLTRNIIQGFSEKTFHNLEQFAIGYFRKQQIGDYIYRLSYDTSALGEFLESGIFPIIVNSLYLCATLVILFLININLALLAITLLPPLMWVLFVFNKRIGHVSEQSENANSSLFSFIEEALTQLKIIQAFNKQREKFHVFTEKQQDSLRGEVQVFGLGYLNNLVIGVIIAVGYSVIIAYGIRSVFLHEMSTGLLVVFIFYLDNLTNPILSIMTAASSLKENYVKISRVKDFYNESLHVHDTGTLTEIHDAEITFSKVSVFGDGGHPIIKNMSFTIPKEKITVIVGVSGSGKSTIISLILRFLEAQHGVIRIGKKDIRCFSIQSLREHIAYVPQEIVLFNDTVQHNITFGNEDYSLQSIHRAANMAIADHFINKLPSTYQFHVGDEGLNLSGGQRQRLMLARAFLREHTPIVIMDEPLSSLDIKTTRMLMKNLTKFAKGKTTIIISNVLDIISLADHVIVLNEGRVLQQGGGRTLLEQKKLSHLISTTP